jgi:hypothetical protein
LDDFFVSRGVGIVAMFRSQAELQGIVAPVIVFKNMFNFKLLPFKSCR